MEDLERHLRMLCVDDTRLRLLEAQWEYDKRLVQQALQTVGSTFPHYSLHDASHSNTILVNITRVLGERVRKLSATDTWLILEAAYWHDVGMIVSDSTLRSWWSSPEFRRHLDELQEANDVVLAASAKLLKNRTQFDSHDEAWPINVRQALIFVVADFARKSHPVRSAEAIRSPSGYRIESPRTLIPQRLFEWLARICLAHGQSQEEVARLPHCENGIGHDMCHPRFVGFMLRLGDLLDLDNGRFCPVLLASIGRIPPTSADHVGKHASITRFYVSPERIDVEATCSDGQESSQEKVKQAHRTYQAVSQWLEWLESELTYLAVGWANIAPSALGGGPPSVGTIRAQLSGYELVPNCSTSDFSVDTDYFLELSKSSGLFGQPQQAWQRELITNAADATLIRLWHTASDAVREQIRAADDPLQKVRELAQDFPIEITIKPCKEVFAAPSMRRWQITIQDHGCGFSLDDLRSLQVIGSSVRNRRRRQLIKDMPEELRPTGSYGLGFQSVFLDAEEVEIETRHLATRQARRVTIARPTKGSEAGIERGDARAGIYIQAQESDRIRFEPGTTISFSVIRSADFGIPEPKDPIQPAPAEPEDHRWREELRAPCASLPVPVLLNGALLMPHPWQEGFSYFDRSQSIRITFPKQLSDERYDQQITQSYRGSIVNRMSDKVLGYTVDVYCLTARDVLRVDRHSFTEFGYKELRKRVDHALPIALEKCLVSLRQKPDGDPRLLQRASFIAHTKYNSNSAGCEWQSLLLPKKILQLGNAFYPVSISELLSNESVEVWVATRLAAFMDNKRSKYKHNPTQMPYLISNEPGLTKLIGEHFKQICWVETIGPITVDSVERFCDVYAASKSENNCERVATAAFEFSLVPDRKGRPRIPCPTEFDGLGLKDNAFVPWARIPAMLSPFTFKRDADASTLTATIEHIERYVEYVTKNRAVTSESERAAQTEVARLTWHLIQKAHAVYERTPSIKWEYDLEQVRAVLEAIQRFQRSNPG